MKSSISTLTVKNANLDSSNTLIEERLDRSIHQNVSLVKTNDSLISAVNTLHQVLKESSIRGYGKSINSTHGLSKYIVRIYSDNPESQIVKEMDVYLFAEGYNMLTGKKCNSDEHWMSKKPTIYYHKDKTEPLARKMAIDIEDFTGIEFRVKKGKGKDIEAGNEEYTILIHYSTNE